ncbi:Hint domain-containing protein [Pedobacter hartonius]|uniref:Intein C-terminal splicing region/intein N-terminal splicing region n=1 Tax=Pedobacter hartonius TaxID=425514 RepID=A0A1H4H9N8_9SPHI|nr:Hint domain-containing protein [Pedobacter hartonius]SEB17822.1 intein C-terminal splicing region/intein N-terminal splicing region [Pedobacter hartonius]
MEKESQWLTEKHYLVCPKGVMFKQMKVMSQRMVSFSGHLAATTADTMIGNPFMCMGMLAAAAPPVSVLQTKALALLAVPVMALPRIGIPPQILLIASSLGTAKCSLSSASRKWIGSSPNLIINRNEGLVVGKSMLMCPSEGVMVQTIETFWMAMMNVGLNKIGHIANFAFGLMAGRGLGTMTARHTPAHAYEPSSLFGGMSLMSRAASGFSLFGPAGQNDLSGLDERNNSNKLLASGHELTIAIFSAKGASLTCFPAGTLVHTSSGLLPVEEIQEGTLLWTVNEKNGQRELKPVKKTHRRSTLNLMAVELENGILFEITPDHRVRSGGEWKEIQNLETADQLENITGEMILIRNIGMLGKSVLVYNFSVADNENYFVTEEGILVHNAGGYDRGYE